MLSLWPSKLLTEAQIQGFRDVKTGREVLLNAILKAFFYQENKLYWGGITSKNANNFSVQTILLKIDILPF